MNRRGLEQAKRVQEARQDSNPVPSLRISFSYHWDLNHQIYVSLKTFVCVVFQQVVVLVVEEGSRM